MAYLTGAFSFVILIASVAIHISSYLPSTILSLGTWLFAMHLGAILAFGTLVVALVERQHRVIAPEPVTLAQRMRIGQYRNQEAMREIRGAAPKIVVAIVVLVATYVFINFFVLMANKEGQPHMGDDGPYLEEHGRFVRALTMEEYREANALQARQFSGHWIIFSLLPTLYFWIIYPRLRLSDALQERPGLT